MLIHVAIAPIGLLPDVFLPKMGLHCWHIYIVVQAVDKWVLGGAEAPPKFGHFYNRYST